MSVTIGSRTLSFAGLGLADNGTLTVDHVRADGVYAIRAKVGSTSVLGKKSGADELVLVPGSNAVLWAADGDVAITVSAKGRYL